MLDPPGPEPWREKLWQEALADVPATARTQSAYRAGGGSPSRRSRDGR